MSTATIEVQEWLDCLTDVAQEFATGSLRFDGGVMSNDPAAKVGTRPAAYISILSDKNSMHLGLATSMQGCRTLTRAFLGVREKDAISEKDVVDAMSEILNIVAGKVKSRLAARDKSLKLGLPIFITGQIQVTDTMERAVANVELGPVPCQLLVFRNKKS
ncbi:MAG: chemotaxis protein CheX [Candidatus Eiseniibacteriota bacterium]